VKTDAHPLEQALMHLVTHARLHMPQGGTLTITASRAQLSTKELTHADMAPGAYIQVQLRDTGAGMDDETLAHVFDPYHPVADGHKGDLSLATAYGILRQSGGCIDVDSTKGEGSVWTILLPETTERPLKETQPLKASA
jgi:signal transduction histidine kinase